MLSFRSSLSILDIKHLSDIWFKIFSPILWVVFFTFLIIPFDTQSLFSFLTIKRSDKPVPWRSNETKDTRVHYKQRTPEYTINQRHLHRVVQSSSGVRGQTTSAFFFLEFSFLLHLWRHTEVLGPGFEPKPQQWQHQFLNPLHHQGTPKPP